MHMGSSGPVGYLLTQYNTYIQTFILVNFASCEIRHIENMEINIKAVERNINKNGPFLVLQTW